MSSNWETVKLGDFCSKIGSGSTPRGGSNIYLDIGQFALIRSQNILNNSFSINGLVYIDANEANKLKNVSVEENDVLLNITGDSVARVCKAPKEYLPARVNQHVAIIRADEINLDSSYLNYYLNSLDMQNYMLSLASTGATRNALTKNMIENFEIIKPPLQTQKKISHILSTLDDKIELNRKMNQTLESMASAIFKSWFVDFDPVHAKANCTDEAELKNIAKELGISKTILDLFPSEFEESELGMIPKGWEDTELSHICKIQSGYAFKSDWWQDTGVKVIKIKNIDGNRVNTLDCECVSEEIATKNSNFKLSSGDMLIAMTGATVGKVGVIYTADEEYLLNQRVGRFQPIAYYDEYVKIFANSSKFFQSIQGQAQGSAQPNISAREIESVKIIKPNDEIMKTFSLLLNPFFSKILEHQGEIQTLEKTRDTLLPKLLSGEIDVSDLSLEME
ncbi:MAG: restriction endonuclease subunit S [Arcobacteraceae bacterium]|jgi:type I restriction enzyme S subunit|nr:restriction endonuclease subunit S [Arcobacteraceae bacterium]